jgi:NAD(P)-dependent dehydrogenase (short-subunit alcohol dehydrogenase family)/pimeloyl-ACP methyl ester carboxylesterase
MASAQRSVVSGDATLAVFEQGDPGAPTVLLVHGYPDTHRMWDGVVALLARRFHVVTYDTRGTGASTGPRGRDGYRTERLGEDLFEVIDAVRPDGKVHVVAHDWGSIQAWEAVTDPDRQHRIASYTTISGPCLDHMGVWLRSRLSRPTPGNLRALASQLVHSWYIYLFHLPVVPELLWRTVIGRNWGRLLKALEGLEPRDGHPADTQAADGALGVRLYRANMLPRLRNPRQRWTDVPVQAVLPARDRYVTPGLTADLDQWVPRLWRRTIQSGHWAPEAKPDVVARVVEEFVDHVEGAPVTRSLQRARAGVPRQRFGDQLVVVTGAGSGIGRATAQLFAGLGAEVVVADIDLAAATANSIGAAAYPYQVDVADERAMSRFADDVATEHGVPDVVVNNAGIGLAGAFLDTTTAEWHRVLDVNLMGVVHGCKQFGDLMVANGEGGHIVNLSSAAAFTPSRTLPAYAASKAGVLMLTECLRAELAGHGIGVSAICPGLVNTNITATTRFAGTDDTRQEALQRKASRAYAKRNFPPERVAEQIVRAVLDNAAVVPVTIEAKAGYLGSRFAPGLMRLGARLNPAK